MKRAFLLAGVLATVVLLAAVVAWREWTHSPKYSLKAVAAAVEKRDRYEFEKHVDLDTMLASFFADLTDGNALAAAVGGAALPQVRAQIIKAIEDGKVPTDSKLASGVQKTLSGELPAIERDGRNAYFSIPTTTNGGAPFTLKLHMTQVADGYWRIDRFTNMKELRSTEAEEERLKKLAAAKAIEDKLKELHIAAKLHTSIGDSWDRKNRFQVRVENKSAKTVAKMTGHIRVASAELNEGVQGSLDIAPNTTGNLTWELDVNRFIPSTVRTYAMGESDRFELDIESITYADGEKVQREP